MTPKETIPFIEEIGRLASNLYRLGWDERNGGNISRLLEEDEVRSYLDPDNVQRILPISFDASALAGRYFVSTGTGKYFKNVERDPHNNLGVFRVSASGRALELLWGYEDGSRPTSELPAHFMTHIERMRVDPAHRIVIHTHATNVVAMTFVHSLDSREFTRTLWRMCTECMVVFPDGIAVLPWMLCGNDEIGRATAEKMKEYRLVVWAHHGIFGTGRNVDEAFGLIETVEKAAEIYMKIAHLPCLQSITDAQLRELADAFGLRPRPGYLDEPAQ